MDYIPFNKPFIAGKELFYIAQAVTRKSPFRATDVYKEMPRVA